MHNFHSPTFCYIVRRSVARSLCSFDVCAMLVAFNITGWKGWWWRWTVFVVHCSMLSFGFVMLFRERMFNFACAAYVFRSSSHSYTYYVVLLWLLPFSLYYLLFLLGPFVYMPLYSIVWLGKADMRLELCQLLLLSFHIYFLPVPCHFPPSRCCDYVYAECTHIEYASSK